MDVRDVGIDPADQVALQHEQAFPEGLALSVEGAVARQDLAVLDDADAGPLGDGCCAIGRPGVDHDDLVEQWDPLHQRVLEGAHDLANRVLLVERGQPEADGDALSLFEIDEPAEVGELAAVKRVFREPAVDALRRRRPRLHAERTVGILQRTDRAGGLHHHHAARQPAEQPADRRPQHHRPVHQAHGRAQHDQLMLRRFPDDRLPHRAREEGYPANRHIDRAR